MQYIGFKVEFYKNAYCIGWVSAVAIYETSHQVPQVFRVAIENNTRGNTMRRSGLEFLTESNTASYSMNRMATSSGNAMVASSGVGMLMMLADLIINGGIGNVATLVTELIRDQKNFMQDVFLNTKLIPYFATCRLGRILEHSAGETSLDELAAYRNSGEDSEILSPYDGVR